MKLLLLAFLATGLSLPAMASTKIKLNPKDAEVKWVGTSYKDSHDGMLKLKEGFVTWTGNELTGGEFVLDMNSITVTDIKDPKYNKKLVGHLKNEDFFEINKYPTAKLTLKDVRMGKGGIYEFLGTLTIKGQSKPIMFTGEMNKGKKKISAKAKIVIDRVQYGITYKSKTIFNQFKDKFIKDKFEVLVGLKFNRPAPQKKKK